MGISIPDMPEQELLGWCQIIRPIVTKATGHRVYLRRLTNYELKTKSYIHLTQETDYDGYVDYNKLYKISDITVYHPVSSLGLFSPLITDIVRQIPKEFLPSLHAFEIISKNDGKTNLTLYSEALQEGFHVSTVRLYYKYRNY